MSAPMQAQAVHWGCLFVNGAFLAAFLYQVFFGGGVMVKGGAPHMMEQDTLVFGLLWMTLNATSAAAAIKARGAQ